MSATIRNGVSFAVDAWQHDDLTAVNPRMRVQILCGNDSCVFSHSVSLARLTQDLLSGQKTGWYYDQRDHRTLLASLVANTPRVLDLYSYAAGCYL